MELSKIFRFEASHILPRHPGKCSRLHGHSWVLKVSVEGEINPETGFVMDYHDLSSVVGPIVEALDHRHLGQWWGHELNIIADCKDEEPAWEHGVRNLPLTFYPSSENLLFWIADQLEGLDSYRHFWSRIELNETCTSAAILTREEYNNVQAHKAALNGPPLTR